MTQNVYLRQICRFLSDFLSRKWDRKVIEYIIEPESVGFIEEADNREQYRPDIRDVNGNSKISLRVFGFH